MNKSRFALLIAAALCAFPATAWAQDEDTAAEGAAEGAEGGEVATDDALLAGEGEMPSEVPGGEGLEDICKIDPAACPELDMKKEAARPLIEQIFAVQPRFILKRFRVEFQPYWGLTWNDQFVDHPAPGLGINFYITEVLAVGVNGNYYEPFNVDKEFNFQVRRAARVSVPLTEYQWGAALNFTYMPALGKFAGFGDFIFQYEAYVVGGVGMLSTRPIPVIDPDNRNFAFEPKIAFNAGLGLKIFFNRWFAVVMEVRDYVFNDQLENLDIDPINPQDESTWLDETRLTNNVQFQAGLSIFVPFSFEYRLPK
jgi:outer membrane beta-barrel protein